MVHATVPSSCRASSPRSASGSPLHDLLVKLDANRIAASAGAIAVNAALLMLLLVPMAAPQLLPPALRVTDVIWVPRDPPKPVEPITVPVVKPRAIPQPSSSVSPPRPVEPQPVPVVSAQPGDIALPSVEPVAAVAAADDAAASIAPPVGAQLQYASAPPPTYPREALRDGLRGTVLLQVLVDIDGKPLQVEVARSSGHRTLDRAAQRQVLARWMFQPALRDGRPVQAIGLVPIEFALD